MYLVGLRIYYKLIHGPYNIKLTNISWCSVRNLRMVLNVICFSVSQVTFGLHLHSVCVYVACLPCQLMTSILITPCNKLLMWTLLCKLFAFKLKINVSLMNAIPKNWKMTNWSTASFPVPLQYFGSLMSRVCQVMYIIRSRTNTTTHSAHCMMPVVGLHARFG